MLGSYETSNVRWGGGGGHSLARALVLPLIRQVPLLPVAAAGTAVTAGAPVSVLRACGFGERNRVIGAVVSIWFSVSHCQCVRSAATAVVCTKKSTNVFPRIGTA